MKQLTSEQFRAWLRDAAPTLGYGEWSPEYVNVLLNGDFAEDFGPVPDLRILHDILRTLGLPYSRKLGRRAEAWDSAERIRRFYDAHPDLQQTTRDSYRAGQIRKTAIDLYGCDGVHIPDEAEIDNSPADGVWVAAHVWVSDKMLKDCETNHNPTTQENTQ